jgi:CheY-specific phosphatase CheX
LFCHLLPTIAGITVDKDSISEGEEPTGDLHQAAILARGVTPLRVEVRVEHQFAVAVARGMASSPDLQPTREECDEVVAELLNIVVGNAVAMLEDDGLHLSLIPPDMAAPKRVGSIVRLDTDSGSGWLLMDPAPAVPSRHGALELGGQ